MHINVFIFSSSNSFSNQWNESQHLKGITHTTENLIPYNPRRYKHPNHRTRREIWVGLWSLLYWKVVNNGRKTVIAALNCGTILSRDITGLLEICYVKIQQLRSMTEDNRKPSSSGNSLKVGFPHDKSLWPFMWPLSSRRQRWLAKVFIVIIIIFFRV